MCLFLVSVLVSSADLSLLSPAPSRGLAVSQGSQPGGARPLASFFTCSNGLAILGLSLLHINLTMSLSIFTKQLVGIWGIAANLEMKGNNLHLDASSSRTRNKE